MTEVSTETLIKKLSEGAVSFKFKKTDGSTREARGTIKEDLIPESKRGATAPSTDGASVSYFDLDKGDWRAFRKDAVITG